MLIIPANVFTLMGEHTREVTAEIPDNLHQRFVATAESKGTDKKELLVKLVREHVELMESISEYADGDPTLATEGVESLLSLAPPIGKLIGFDLVEMGSGRTVMSLSAGPQHANPMGTLHGGVLCDLGDAAMGTAFASTLGEGESFTTLELDVKYLKPVWDADLTATAEVVKRGRQTGLVECDVTDDEGSLVAKLNSVCMVLRGEAASGR
jgi:uncharacterized protein (TIGR00369 family)